MNGVWLFNVTIFDPVYRIKLNQLNWIGWHTNWFSKMELQTISDTYFTLSVGQCYHTTQNRIFSHSKVRQTTLYNAVCFLLVCAFFWVIPRHPSFMCRRFGSLCLFHLHRQVGMKKLAYKIQALGNYPEESIKHSEHSESLKKRINP